MGASEQRRREDRGAERDRRGEGSGEFFDIGSQIGEFWCILGAFCTVHPKGQTLFVQTLQLQNYTA